MTVVNGRLSTSPTATVCGPGSTIVSGVNVPTMKVASDVALMSVDVM